MARRPKLSDDSFLKHLFAPSKNPLPTGLRKTTLVGTKGRSKGRLAAYNRMSAKNQEILKRAGTRDAYLRGETSLSESRKVIRQQAVSKGIAKPLRIPAPNPARSLDNRIAGYVYRSMTQVAQRPVVNGPAIEKRVPYLPSDVKRQVLNWTPSQIRAYAADNENMVTIGTKQFNPLWYR
jgi:hypothetical protein